MKKLIFFCLFALSFNSFASECVQPEAQFIGTVKNLYTYQDDYSQLGECSFQLNIKEENFKPSKVFGCAIELNEVLNTTFTFDFYHDDEYTTCPVVAEGQAVSGYLIKVNNKIEIE